MRIIWHGVPPWNNTGYGVQTHNIVRRLMDDGHEVKIVATCQLHGAHTVKWGPYEIHSPGNGAWAEDRTIDLNRRWQADMVISLLDIWVLREDFGVDLDNWYPMTPIDTWPMSPPATRRLSLSKMPLAMTKYGQSEIKRLLNKDAPYLPHSIDCNVFRPQGVRLLGDEFVVGVVATNMSGDRKSFNEMFAGFSAFKKKCPKAVLYLHTNPTTEDGGYNLLRLAEANGIMESILCADQFEYAEGVLDHKMAEIYSSFDVLLAPSKSEGFCIPLIEAQACGVPVITGNWGAMDENNGVGWRVPGYPTWTTLDAFWYTPKIADIADKLESAYRTRGKKELATAAREFALKFDHELVYNKYWKPFLEGVENDKHSV